jgi:hypothetical protein
MTERAFKIAPTAPWASGAEFTLTWSGERPASMGLYIWELPFGRVGTQILKEAVVEITGLPVASITFRAGNGHGDMEIIYEEII